MTTARIPELGERVQMGKFATAFRGVWGQVIKVDDNPPKVPILGKQRGLIRGAAGGVNHTEIYILTNLTNQGKRVVIKASPYELDGGVLDDRPIFVRG
jgi:hypothetical protein